MTIFIPPNMHPGTVRDVGYVDVNYTVKLFLALTCSIICTTFHDESKIFTLNILSGCLKATLLLLLGGVTTPGC
ncbi:hypothetical protein EB796_018363 [Bugula neritina]|uniref:Uncharacterized protein n=1 Tax=Bugula neritina TaxID=10212 RepID=A0A7J7JCF5_BUGNE|nr:hypothetical protein EB796_018363 [Bugula neritina]